VPVCGRGRGRRRLSLRVSQEAFFPWKVTTPFDLTSNGEASVWYILVGLFIKFLFVNLFGGLNPEMLTQGRRRRRASVRSRLRTALTVPASASNGFLSTEIYCTNALLCSKLRCLCVVNS